MMHQSDPTTMLGVVMALSFVQVMLLSIGLLWYLTQ